MAKRKSNTTKTVEKIETTVETPKVSLETTFVEELHREHVEEIPLESKDKPVKQKKVWVKDWRELVSVEGVNQLPTGKEYYGVKRND